MQHSIYRSYQIQGWDKYVEGFGIAKILTLDKENFKEYLQVILKQIKQIENLVNEFSDFARMPTPLFKKNNLRTP